MRPRLLVVDDEHSIRFGLGEYFSQHGFDVDTAEDRATAEALIHRNTYAAAVVDLALDESEPEGGLAVVRCARHHCPTMRVLVMTARTTPQAEAAAEEIGVDASLTKPEPLPTLLKLITASRMAEAPGQTASGSPAPSPPIGESQ